MSISKDAVLPSLKTQINLLSLFLSVSFSLSLYMYIYTQGFISYLRGKAVLFH